MFKIAEPTSTVSHGLCLSYTRFDPRAAPRVIAPARTLPVIDPLLRGSNRPKSQKTVTALLAALLVHLQNSGKKSSHCLTNAGSACEQINARPCVSGLRSRTFFLVWLTIIPLRQFLAVEFLPVEILPLPVEKWADLTLLKLFYCPDL